MIRVALLAAASAALTSCGTLPTEQRLLGTWRMPVDEVEDEYGVTHRQSKLVEITLKPDHTYTSTDVARGHVLTGRWWLSGRWLTSEFPRRTSGRRTVERYRDKISRLTERELIFSEDGSTDSKWTKVR